MKLTDFSLMGDFVILDGHVMPEDKLPHKPTEYDLDIKVKKIGMTLEELGDVIVSLMRELNDIYYRFDGFLPHIHPVIREFEEQWKADIQAQEGEAASYLVNQSEEGANC